MAEKEFNTQRDRGACSSGMTEPRLQMLTAWAPAPGPEDAGDRQAAVAQVMLPSYLSPDFPWARQAMTNRSAHHSLRCLRAFGSSVRSQPTSRRAWRLLSCFSASKRSTAPTAPRVFRGRRQSSLISSEGEAGLR